MNQNALIIDQVANLETLSTEDDLKSVGLLLHWCRLSPSDKLIVLWSIEESNVSSVAGRNRAVTERTKEPSVDTPEQRAATILQHLEALGAH